MASEKLQVILELVTGQYKREAGEAATATGKIGAAATTSAGGVGRLQSGLGLLRGAVAVVGVTRLIGEFQDLAQAAADDAKEQAILATVMRDTVTATDEQIAASELWVSAMQRQTGVADSQLRPALADLLTFGMDVEESQKNIAIAMDIATAKGIPLETVVRAIGKASQGTVGALGRLGIAVKDEQGNILAFDEVMQNAADTMGGTMAAAAATAAGQAQIVGAAFAELKESLGATLIKPLGIAAITALQLIDTLGPMGATAAGVKSILATLAIEGIDVMTNKTAAAITALQDSKLAIEDIPGVLDVLQTELQLTGSDYGNLRQVLLDGNVDLSLSKEATDALVLALQTEQATLATMHPAAHRPAEIAALGTQLTAQLQLNDAQLAAASPTFALVNAANAVDSAFAAYNETILTTGIRSEETEDAAIRLGEAELRLDAASKVFSEEGGQQGIDALVGILTEAGVAQTVIDGVRESIELLNGTPITPKTIRIDTAQSNFGRIEEFASGGVVGGPRGSRQLIVAHGGETVLPTQNMSMPSGWSRPNGPTININSPTTQNLAQDLQLATILATVNTMVEVQG